MAIIIPSKNIYDISNPKVRNNTINNVSVGQVIVKPKNEFKVAVYNDTISNYGEKSANALSIPNSKYNYYPSSASDIGFRIRAVCGYSTQRTIQNRTEVLIPKVSENAFISKIYSGSNVQISLRIKQTSATNGSIIYKTPSNSFESPRIALTNEQIIYSLSDFAFSAENLDVDRIDGFYYSDIDFASSISLKVQSNRLYIENNLSANWSGDGVNATTARYFEESILPSVTITDAEIDGTEYYKISLSEFLVAISADFYDGIIADRDQFADEASYVINLARIKQEVQEVTLKIDGDTIGISITDGAFQVGNGNAPFSLEGNEIIQDSGTFGNLSITENIANNILREYQNGKETAEIVCQIGDYYKVEPVEKLRELVIRNATNDNRFEKTDDYIIFTDPEAVEITKVIRVEGYPDADTTILSSYDFEIINKNQIRIHSSMFGADFYSGHIDYNALYEQSSVAIGYDAERMTFSNGDTVVPMIRNPQGVDIPMSRNKDGSAKKFTVYGVDVFYDGAVWQKLSLQETGVENG